MGFCLGIALGCSKPVIDENERKQYHSFYGFVIEEHRGWNSYSFQMHVLYVHKRDAEKDKFSTEIPAKPKIIVNVIDWSSTKPSLDEELEKWDSVTIDEPYTYYPKGKDEIRVRREQLSLLTREARQIFEQNPGWKDQYEKGKKDLIQRFSKQYGTRR